MSRGTNLDKSTSGVRSRADTGLLISGSFRFINFLPGTIVVVVGAGVVEVVTRPEVVAIVDIAIVSCVCKALLTAINNSTIAAIIGLTNAGCVEVLLTHLKKIAMA